MPYDYTYRVNTDVITSVMVRAASGDITPDTRHKEKDTRKSAYTNPSDGKAYVTITDYTYTRYTASIQADIELKPDVHNPTAKENYGEYIIASGYGVDIKVEAGITTNAPSGHYTTAQNVVTYFPEFHYDNYWRLLDKTGGRIFEFKENSYSTFNSRTHFTPLPYPDGAYEVYSKVIDCWTPDGMLRVNLNDVVTIDGSVYDDWHVAPDLP